MSDVVGTCTDCIISLPNAKPQSLKYTVSVTQGNNSILAHRGTAYAYFPSDMQSVQRLQIAVAGTYSPGQAPDSLMIATDQPIQVTVIRGALSDVFNVNKLLFLDDTSITNFIIANPADATATANVLLAFTVN